MSVTVNGSRVLQGWTMEEDIYVPDVFLSNVDLVRYLSERRNPSFYARISYPEPEMSYPEATVLRREVLEQKAVEALTALVQMNPLSLPVVRTAIEQGRIDGSTYGEYPIGVTSPRCIIGWAMVATGTVYSDAPQLRIDSRWFLEQYVGAIREGETHLTNKRLAVLYAALLTIASVDIDTTDDVVIPIVEDSVSMEVEKPGGRLCNSITDFINSLEEEEQARSPDGQSARELSFA